MEKNQKELTYKEIKAETDQLESEYRKLRESLMTPEEMEYIWENLIIPKLHNFPSCDGESAEKSVIKQLIKEATDSYIKQREERRELGLSPLVEHDIDALGRDEGESLN